MVKRVVLFNGPARSGKNTAAEWLRSLYPSSCLVLGFSHHLKRCVHSMHFGAAGWSMDPDCFDAVKGVPQPMLGGRTWRQEYIAFSEGYIKPRHGDEWFGEKFVETMNADPAELVAVPDSGFRGEAVRVVREVGPENVLLIRMHKSGLDFAGDSRSYIHMADLGVTEANIENVHDKPGLMRLEVKLVYSTWLLRGHAA